MNRLMKSIITKGIIYSLLVLVTACGGGGSNEPVQKPDITPPIINLTGDSAIILVLGDSYQELGATANDETDGAATVTITGSVDTNTLGDYIITYSASDSASNTSSVSRTISVIDRVVSQTELINNISSLLDNSSCTDDNCNLVDVAFTPANDWSNQQRPRQRILIIDTGMSALALTGNRNRVLELYKAQEDMTLAQYRPTLEMPDSIDAVFNAIDKYGSFVSVQKFREFQTDEVQQLLVKITNTDAGGIGHGYPIAAFMLEHNPDAQVVFVEGDDDSYLYSPREACEQLLSSDENEHVNALFLIQNRFDNYLESISTIVQEHKINYINASWGISKPLLKSSITRTCDGTPSDTIVSAILEIDHQFMIELAQLSYLEENSALEQPIILVQAGAAGYSDILYEGHLDFPSDCDSSMTHRLRVTDMKYKNTDIPEFGTSDDGLLSTYKKDGWECFDLYLPLGQYFENGPKTREKTMRWIEAGFWETDDFPAISTSSMAAPVVVSSLIYQQSLVQEKLSPQQLFESVTHNLKIIDPIQHDQFTVYTQGYREIHP
jgi:hypothetical protein